MDAKHFFGARGVQFIDAALRPQGLVEQGAHGSVRDEHGIAESLLEFINSHGREHSPGYSAKMNSSVYRFAIPVCMRLVEWLRDGSRELMQSRLNPCRARLAILSANWDGTSESNQQGRDAISGAI